MNIKKIILVISILIAYLLFANPTNNDKTIFLNFRFSDSGINLVDYKIKNIKFSGPKYRPKEVGGFSLSILDNNE